MGIILYVLSQLLGLILFPIGILFGVIKSFWKVQIKTGLRNGTHKFLILAKSFDKYGNVVCKELFDSTLITKDSNYPFGKIEQTISMVLGYNQQENTLSKVGKAIVWILDKCEKNHCIKAIGKDK